MFGQTTQASEQNEAGENTEDNAEELGPCEECVVKGMEIDSLKERNAKLIKKTNDWYENEAEKQKQIFLKKLEDQNDEIERLTKENQSLKARNEELGRAKDLQRDEMVYQPTPSTSIVAQAMTMIVGEFIHILINKLKNK